MGKARDILEIQYSVAVLTGAASGISRAFAEHWTERGGRTALADLAEDSLEAFRRTLRQDGAEVISRTCDVAREEDNEGLPGTPSRPSERSIWCCDVVSPAPTFQRIPRKRELTGKI